MKLVVAAMVSMVQNDRNRNRYSVLYRLVRADGIGTWVEVLDTVLFGPPSSCLHTAARTSQKQLTKKYNSDWPFEAVNLLIQAMAALGIATTIGRKVSIRDWFRAFTTLRNKSRGHGAPKAGQCSAACPSLERSISLLADNLLVFKMPWAYLHQNLSGKYRVTHLGGDLSPFRDLMGTPNLVNVADGVYIAPDGLNTLTHVDLVESDADATDFLIANGQFTDDHYETLSYVSNERVRASSERYLIPPTELPPSQTEGLPDLDTIGECWTNLPQAPAAYVTRPALQKQLLEQLLLTRHEIVTLTGPGGIGKTTLALRVLHDLLCDATARFNVVIWFSARDIDLLASGPKPVKPRALTLDDFARQIAELIGERDTRRDQRARIKVLSKSLEQGVLEYTTLFVFDNFETVDRSAEVFKWLDTYIRPPNKVLITTRMREFAGDYPVHVTGLTDDEARQLIGTVARELGISAMVDNAYQDALIRESDGHPYVIKILLGEVEKAQKTVKLKRIIASEDEILTVLFERTFAALSPAAQRVFLLLASWRSVVPEIAVEAVILRSRGDRVNVRNALDELYRYSLAEVETSESDDQAFVAVPLAAMLFGRMKLSVSPMKAVVDADRELLYAFGAGRKEGVRHGALPQVKRLLRYMFKQVSTGKSTLQDTEPLLHFLAGRLPSFWLEIAKFYEELRPPDAAEKSKQCLRRYLERSDDVRTAAAVWRRLADLCEKDHDYSGQVHALVEMCEIAGAPRSVISSIANRINGIYFQLRRQHINVLDDDERRSLIRRVASRMEAVSDELDATDCSRLAWLYVQLGDLDGALNVAKKGLRVESHNQHCLGLVDRLESTR